VTPQAAATIDSKYRVVIPSDARDGLEPGQMVLIDYSAKGRKLSMSIVPAKIVADI
jgi:bifunctional DNA-binding transcriptional regulator/antitoxin component of YhaV-PrlF toxin-antitoxin module